MMSNTIPTPTAPGAVPCGECPRCGYDLRGLVATWNDCCPLDGRCSECGLDFAWANVLNPRMTTPDWSFEHAQTRLIRKFLHTLLQTFRPWRLFAGLRMEHPIHFGRIVALLAACALALHLGVAAICTSYRYALYGGLQMGWGRAHSTLADVGLVALWPYSSGHLWWLASRSPLGPGPVVVAPTIALMPVAFLLLPDTLRRSRVRRAHIARVGLYSFVAPCLIWSALAVLWSAHYAINWHNRISGGIAVQWLPSDAAMFNAMLAGSLLLLLWAPFFWWRAGKQYLKLPHPLIVAILLSIVSFLMTLALWALYAASQ